jgi:hypothetical protein
VRGTSTSSPAASGTASVTILPMPSISSVSPSPVSTGNFTLTVDGDGFTPGSSVSFDGVVLPTTVLSSTQLRSTGNAPAAKSAVPVVVSTTDGEISNAFHVNVVAAAAITVSISPASATVRIKKTQQFTATVQNSANTSVIWKVNGVAGGNSTVGTISSSGVYRAPNSPPNPAVVTVTATAAADQTKTAAASVTVSRR